MDLDLSLTILILTCKLCASCVLYASCVCPSSEFPFGILLHYVGGVVAHEISVSTQGPLVLVLGLKGLGPGLDNMNIEQESPCPIDFKFQI